MRVGSDALGTPTASRIAARMSDLVLETAVNRQAEVIVTFIKEEQLRAQTSAFPAGGSWLRPVLVICDVDFGARRPMARREERAARAYISHDQPGQPGWSGDALPESRFTNNEDRSPKGRRTPWAWRSIDQCAGGREDLSPPDAGVLRRTSSARRSPKDPSGTEARGTGPAACAGGRTRRVEVGELAAT